MELSEEQVERAAAAAFAIHNEGGNWNGSTIPSDYMREQYRSSMRAAAPFVQLPWEEPTKIEMNELYGNQAHLMICKFVRRRNALLLPKPVDPRRDVIAALVRLPHAAETPEAFADRVLKALDEVKS